jgi:hypothetical protein
MQVQYGLATPILDVTSDGDSPHMTAPEFHFLTGKPLDWLKDANTVVGVGSGPPATRPPRGQPRPPVCAR